MQYTKEKTVFDITGMEAQEQANPITRDYIQIDKIIAAKSERLYRLLPGFVIRYLKRILHQDFINEFLYRNRDDFGMDFVYSILRDFNTHVISHNEKNIPVSGRYVIAANHPLGGLDGIALMGAVGKVRKDIVFPVNDLLLNLPNLKELFIPINKHGSNAQNVQIINDTFASDKTILYFPAGLVSRKQKGQIKDLTWHKSFLNKAKRYERDIIPAYIHGRNTNFFYNLANLRKFLGIKANIEMLYLVDETYKQNDKTIDIVFGEPISYKTFNKSHPDSYWAESLKDRVYELNPHK